MTKYLKYMLPILVACVAPHAQGAPQTPPSAPVTVVNTTSNPVPITAPSPLSVTGTVNLGNTTLPVSVTNFPATQPVSVTNSSATSERFTAKLDLNNAFVVPAGKTAVLEYISGICTWSSSNNLVQLGLFVYMAAAGFDHEVVLIPHANSNIPNGTAYMAFSQPIRDFLPPGWSLIIDASLTGSLTAPTDTGPDSCFATLVGYYMPKP